jgi:hypothetical protein
MIVEALSLRVGVIFGKLRGVSWVVVEVDCLELVNLLNSRAVSRSVVALILLEIEGLASTFNFFVIHHVKRAANMPAHMCAKFACTQDETCCWMNLAPSFLMSSASMLIMLELCFLNKSPKDSTQKILQNKNYKRQIINIFKLFLLS